jgi:hypothetical protein
MLDTHEAQSVEFSLAHSIYEARNTKARVLRVLSRSLLQKRVPQHQLNLTSSLTLYSQYGERRATALIRSASQRDRAKTLSRRRSLLVLHGAEDLIVMDR